MRLVGLLFAVAAASALLGACLPVATRVPAGSTVGFKVDPVLVGSWRAVASDGNSPAYIQILGNDDGTMTAVVVTPADKKNHGDRSVYTLRAATLGGNHILNAREVSLIGRASTGPPTAEHVLLAYRVEAPGKIGLYRMDDEATAAAIRAGEIAGEIEPGKTGDVRITASEPALDRFLGTPRAARLFNQLLITMTRQK
jgi:hypothetical protein